jgi:hypothetical protein
MAWRSPAISRRRSQVLPACGLVLTPFVRRMREAGMYAPVPQGKTTAKGFPSLPRLAEAGCARSVLTAQEIVDERSGRADAG